jgi:hypothetical protein
MGVPKVIGSRFDRDGNNVALAAHQGRDGVAGLMAGREIPLMIWAVISRYGLHRIRWHPSRLIAVPAAAIEARM